ncbi:MAG: histidinol dehydrogenase [Nitrospinae bacterium RIFCSPLOWO2_02_39_17]|nr:MAG: histidinol dehydrogenase [Nitrospinae bacterium RIFCSPLOWO2_02_39_17]HLA48596.1 histidinol dehydrogenase [Nitrospinota bacterium]
MKIVKTWEDGFDEALNRIVTRGIAVRPDVEASVRNIINKVKEKGDEAVIKFTKKFDNYHLSPENIKVSGEEIENAYASIDKKILEHLKLTAERIKKFHEHQVEKSWSYNEDGVLLGQIIRPLAIVGVYAPGGKASYPSSVLMNVIPAKVAGVKKVIMCTPASAGRLNPSVLIAADIVGVDEIFCIGGAQAIAGMAYGTETIPRVDKIVGPGNIFVAEAKRMVFGDVDIDMVAGPSEILVIADKSARADFIAADLLSQAEHDELAYPLFITDSLDLATDVVKELDIQKKSLSRSEIIDNCLKNNCICFVVKDIDEGIELSNKIAPEHLELMIEDPDKMIDKVQNAGAIFLGKFTPEAIGDYAAGPNHVLPTGGTARFFSPLGVYDFVKRSSLISFNEKSLKDIAPTVKGIAEAEGLTAHAKAIEIRLK